jgi:hypothetical protein
MELSDLIVNAAGHQVIEFSDLIVNVEDLELAFR